MGCYRSISPWKKRYYDWSGHHHRGSSRFFRCQSSLQQQHRPPSSLCFCGTIATRLLSTLTPLSSDAAREDRPLLGPSLRTDLDFYRKSVWLCQARRPLQPARGRVARSANRSTSTPSRCFAKRTIARCSDLLRHHCLLPRRTALFLLPFPVHLVAFATFSSISPVFLACHCVLYSPVFRCHWVFFLPRWRLALAQEAARGYCGIASFPYFR